ncbi:MAG TPA: hypothetical protein VF099_10120 [Ktedonobacterales bacterium]
MAYSDLEFKIPLEQEDYVECSDFVIKSIEAIMRAAIDEGRNKIIINTNLKLGLPMENINKVAGPFVEAWAQEIFVEALNDGNNQFQLINVEARERLNMADIVLQFRRDRKNNVGITANVDVKATAEDILSSGRSPNITSFARIRTAYIQDPDYIFIILSLKHKVYSTRDQLTGLMNGIMEVVSYRAYDLKFISEADISYNPALGTGQIQIRDINYIKQVRRTTWEFCQLLDRKFIASKKGMNAWLTLAKLGGWIKE